MLTNHSIQCKCKVCSPTYVHVRTCTCICITDYAVSCSALIRVTFWPSQPDNIMVQVNKKTETVKLLDFGAARHYGTNPREFPLEHSYEPVACNQFLPPEALKQQPLGPPADIW